MKGVAQRVTLIDDYGHHPAEIRATLEAARGCEFERLTGAVSAAPLFADAASLGRFLRAFNLADVLVLTDIYAASEAPIEGMTSEALARAIRAAGHKHVFYCSSMQEGIERMLRGSAAGRCDSDDWRGQREPREQ